MLFSLAAFGAYGVVGWCARSSSNKEQCAQFATLCRDASGRCFFSSAPSEFTSCRGDAGAVAQVSWCPGRPGLCIVRSQRACELCTVQESGGALGVEVTATWATQGCAMDFHRSLPIAAVVTHEAAMIYSTSAPSEKPLVTIPLSSGTTAVRPSLGPPVVFYAHMTAEPACDKNAVIFACRRRPRVLGAHPGSTWSCASGAVSWWSTSMSLASGTCLR